MLMKSYEYNLWKSRGKHELGCYVNAGFPNPHLLFQSVFFLSSAIL